MSTHDNEEPVSWDIVCPDGACRHFPYLNEADARFDAALISRRNYCNIYGTIKNDCPDPRALHVVQVSTRTFQ